MKKKKKKQESSYQSWNILGWVCSDSQNYLIVKNSVGISTVIIPTTIITPPNQFASEKIIGELIIREGGDYRVPTVGIFDQYK
mgnify:CR=1 FL=1